MSRLRIAGLMEIDLAQQEFIGALQAIGGSSGNGRLRELLSWSEADYDSLKAALIASGQVTPGRGLGGSVAMADPAAPSPSARPQSATLIPPPVATSSSPASIQPAGKQNLSAFIWSVADLLRGDYKLPGANYVGGSPDRRNGLTAGFATDQR